MATTNQTTTDTATAAEFELTPPDPVSQIGLALPAILLYEISIYTARLVEKKRAAEAVAREEASSHEGSSGTVGPAKG